MADPFYRVVEVEPDGEREVERFFWKLLPDWQERKAEQRRVRSQAFALAESLEHARVYESLDDGTGGVVVWES